MAYATIQDLIDRFTETEIRRLSGLGGALPALIETTTVNRALDDATALVESYLRKRYQLPIAAPTADIIRATCILTRYDLATGGDKEPTTQMKDDRAEVIKWLASIASGAVSLEGAAQVATSNRPRFSDRARIMTRETLAGD